MTFLGGRTGQDQPHADPLPAVRGHHRTHPPADRRCFAPQGTGRRPAVPVWGHPAAGVFDPGGALRFVPLPLDQGAGRQRQDRGGGQVALSWQRNGAARGGRHGSARPALAWGSG